MKHLKIIVITFLCLILEGGWLCLAQEKIVSDAERLAIATKIDSIFKVSTCLNSTTI
jgi:hypothetical protein